MNFDKTAGVRSGGPKTQDIPLIAHVIYRLQTGGMENGLVNLLNNLPNDHYRHAVICLTNSTAFEERIQSRNVSIHELHKKAGKDPKVYLEFWQLLRQLKPAIVHTRNLGTLDLAPLASLARVPVRIHGEHGWDIADSSGSGRKHQAIRKICDLAVSEYVSVSSNIAEWLVRKIGISANRVNQIYNGVDVALFRPDGPRADIPFLQTMSVPVVLGAIGRIDPIKNYEWLMNALAAMLSQYPEFRERVRLILIGDGPLLDQHREAVIRADLEDVVWLAGRRDDIPEILRCIDIFVLPSINEGISNTLLESMATALPAVASDVGGNSELIVQGETGKLVPVNDADAMIAALVEYIRTPKLRRQHGTAARLRAEEAFSLQKMVGCYAEMYDRHLGGSTNKEIL